MATYFIYLYRVVLNSANIAKILIKFATLKDYYALATTNIKITIID